MLIENMKHSDMNGIRHSSDIFCSLSHTHPNPLVRQIGNYTVADLTNMYRKNKRPKHILL